MYKEKKNKILLLLCSLVVVTSLGIGGTIYVVKQIKVKEKQKEVKELKYEKLVAKQTKNTFQDIISITFDNKDSGYEPMTGWQFSLKIETIQSKKIGKFGYIDTFLDTTEEKLSNYSYGQPMGKYVIEGKTNNKINVIYTNGQKEKI